MPEPRPQDLLLPIQQAVYDVGEALEYPIDKHGNHYDLRYLIPVLAWHLPRAGIGKVPGLAVVKRRLYSNGVVDWVPLDHPDDPRDPLDGVTLEDLENGTPEQRAAAIRRLQGEQPEDLDALIPWTVRTNIQVDEEAL